jgi:hypothetical protein
VAVEADAAVGIDGAAGRFCDIMEQDREAKFERCIIARNLLLGLRPLREPGPDRRAGKRGLRGKRGQEEVKSAELAVISEEKRDATGLLQWPTAMAVSGFDGRIHSTHM